MNKQNIRPQFFWKLRKHDLASSGEKRNDTDEKVTNVRTSSDIAVFCFASYLVELSKPLIME